MTKPSWNKITVKDLTDDERLKALYIEAVRLKWWANNDLAVLEFFMYAEKALQEDTKGTPGALFYHLIKDKKNPNISQVHEDRAMMRVPSIDRNELVNTAAGRHIDTEEEQEQLFGGRDKIGYMHSVMVQCFLPQKHTNARRYVSNHGKASLVVESGVVADPHKENTFKDVPLPYGSYSRLILPWINRYSIQNKTLDIDLGHSLREFMNRVGRTVGGDTGKGTTASIESIAAAQFILGQWDKDTNATRTKYGRVTSEVEFWTERDPEQGMLWTQSMVLTQEYYNLLKERPTPIDLEHLGKLTKRVMAMDLYCWLSYRLPLIPKGKTLRIPLHKLHQIFGRDITAKKHFSLKFREALKAVAEVHRDFRVEVEKGLLIAHYSPPPVAPRNLVYLPGIQSGDKEAGV